MKIRQMFFMVVACITISTTLLPGEQVIRKVFSPIEWAGKWAKRIAPIFLVSRLFNLRPVTTPDSLITGLQCDFFPKQTFDDFRFGAEGVLIAVTLMGYFAEKAAKFLKNEIVPLYDIEAWKHLHKKEFEKKLTKICLCQPQ